MVFRDKKKTYIVRQKIIVTAAVNEQICFIIKQKGWNIKNILSVFVAKIVTD